MYSPTFSRLFGLDCLRALAISLVLISHCTFLIFPNVVNTPIQFLRLLGSVGVDLFFVLSGYLIGGIILKIMNETKFGWRQLLNFWKRRWYRTLPNYFLILVVNIIILFFTLGELPNFVPLYFVFLQNFFSAHPDFFTEAWSLSIEEHAYILLPFLFFVGVYFNLRANKNHLFLVITIMAIVLLFFYKLEYFVNIKVYSYKDWSLTFRKVVVYRLDSIYLGFVLVYLMSAYPKFFHNNKKFLLLIGLGIFTFLHITMFAMDVLPQTHFWFYTFFYLPFVIISLALLFPYFLTLNASNRIKKIILFISTRSYAIYLVNYSLILLTLQLLIDIPQLPIFIKTLLVIGFLLLSILLSNLIYLYFEKPILKYRDRRYPRQASK